jgi:cytidylyltransferase family
MGGAGTYFGGKKKDNMGQKNNWLKYFTYFFIIVFLYGFICFAEKVFSCICLLISFSGLIEIISLQKKNPQRKIMFYLILIIYIFISVGFYCFGGLSQSMLLFTLFIVCTFDAFCQISGQIFGKRKISPRLSPNKTYEGLFGGLFMAVCSSLIVGRILNIPISVIIVLGLYICFFSFAGDLSASWVKRKYGVKDFSKVLPGHGGFLDRFDSFIVSGAFVYVINLFFDFK